MLGVERVGLDDDFFALGGDSLIATRVSARLQLALGREVPVRYLFDAPTVGDLAEYLDRHRGGPAHPPLRVMPRRSGFRCRCPAVVVPGAVAGALTDLQHGGGVAAGWALDADALGAALTDVVGRQESLRTLFPRPRDPAAAGGAG